jgi:RNA polymerase sigma factor (sigma-70 family)
MASGLRKVIDHIQMLVGPPEGNSSRDGQLLARFLTVRDQASFTLLVRRHGPMVLAVCRRVLGNIHDAEDAFQATFMIMARKAAHIRQSSVAGWLHTVAHRTALEARHSSAPRRRREKQVDKMPEREFLQAESQDWRALLDLGLNELAENQREAILLCDLEGVSRREAARRLRIPEGTLSSRLNRARSLLAERLRRHGVVLSAAALATAVSGNGACAVTRELVMRTSKSVLLLAAGHPAVPLTPAGVLMKGVLKEMLIAKLKGTVCGAAVVVALTAGGIGYLAATLAAAPAQLSPALAPAQPNQKDEQDKLLKTIIQGHRANLKAIRSLHAKLRVESTRSNGAIPNLPRALVGEWWEAGGKIRLEEHRVDGYGQTSAYEDYLVDGGRTYQLTSRPGDWGMTLLAGRIWEDNKTLGLSFLDLWSRLGFTDQYSPRHFVADILEDPAWTKSVTKRKLGKEDLVEVVCRKETSVMTLLLIPSQGYLVKRMEHLYHGPKNGEVNGRILTQIDGIRECEPGVFFPTHSIRTFDVGQPPSQLLGKNESFVDDLAVNQPIEKELFEPLIPEGVRTWDLVKRLQYVMGPDGRPSPNHPITELKNGVPVNKGP